jgi:hypothetical protein
VCCGHKKRPSPSCGEPNLGGATALVRPLERRLSRPREQSHSLPCKARDDPRPGTGADQSKVNAVAKNPGKRTKAYGGCGNLLLRVCCDDFVCKDLMRQILKGLIPVIRMGFHDLVNLGRKFVEEDEEGG